MTAKRFKVFVGKHYGVQAADGEVIFDSISSIAEADVLVDWLNELYKENEQLKEENQVLKNELNEIEQLLQSYRKTIKHDAELLADATKKGYLPPLEDWEEL